MEHVLKLKNKISSIHLLPAYVDAIGDSLTLSQVDRDNLNLVLEEAVSNVISYAYPKGEEHSLCLKAICEAEKLTLTVTDHGIPFDPTQHTISNANLSMSERPIGGLGIFLMSRLMDRISYRRENDQNILTMYKNYCETESAK